MADLGADRVAYDATVALVTRDRAEDLRRALRSAVQQEGRVEIVVVDDGSRDGSSQMVAAEFPQVRLIRFEESAGLVARRNQAAHFARAPIVISIDDDAEFSSHRVVLRTLLDFDHPRIGAVAIPYIDTPRPHEECQRAPEPQARWISATFRGTAYAVRRDLFLALGGFRELIMHQGEEPDYTLRLLAAGYVVRLGRAEPVLHHESPKRNLGRMARYGRRNEQLLAFTYFPAPVSIVMMLGYAIKGLRLGFRLGNAGEMLRGVAFGLSSCWSLRAFRQPISLRVVVLDRRLRHRKAVTLATIEHLLPPLKGQVLKREGDDAR